MANDGVMISGGGGRKPCSSDVSSTTDLTFTGFGVGPNLKMRADNDA
jgi:hypothetical protein